MKQLKILLYKDWLELLRTKKIIVIGCVFIFFAILSPVSAKMLPEIIKAVSTVTLDIPKPTIYDSYAQFIKNIGQIGVYVMIIALGGLIANEKKNGMYINLKMNGVHTSNFILSKLVIQILVIGAIYITCIALFALYNLILFKQAFASPSLLAFLGFFLYIIFVLCIITFFGSITKSSMSTIMLSFVVTFILMLFDLFAFGKYLPNYLLSASLLVLKDTTYIDIIIINSLITLSLSLLLVFMSIRLYRNKA